ncbi:MAG: hypothetical protein KDB01_02790 [Planctomycetaceae bacterium]|nr:hypothetical protein [Planctomycetaceae bacterium]
MKIVNRTKWKTEQLRAIAKEIAGRYLESNERSRLTVYFQPSKKWVHGEANVGRPGSKTQLLYTKIWLPNRFTPQHPEQRLSVIDSRYARSFPGASPLRASIASTLAHEFAHNAGRRGERSMRADHCPLGWAAVHRGEWDEFETWPLELAQPVTKQKRKTGDDEALAAVEQRIRRWESKLKRAQTWLKKCRRQKRYYESKIAASAPDTGSSVVDG